MKSAGTRAAAWVPAFFSAMNKERGWFSDYLCRTDKKYAAILSAKDVQTQKFS